MKITCHCGRLIPDQTDGLPQKAHVIPDQNWNQTWEQIDKVLRHLAGRKTSEEAAAMQLRRIVSRVTRIAYQCPDCGRLYLNDEQGKLHSYVPHDDGTSRTILQS
ncbi:ubiquitin family protein [Planctomicrobium piriforme]|uniref:C2H2-type domain-containing protein n=1 Tax=Planctomicrobium piriforme TaxID=1576369 RepID=A0A1I3HV49_9PLAN|nr:hypothetical protein [Planctomicrobium piriforme]SFI39638.1 hypothetical protein SAMN05421753_108207 [Planctomicrobium piriforme]